MPSRWRSAARARVPDRPVATFEADPRRRTATQAALSHSDRSAEARALGAEACHRLGDATDVLKFFERDLDVVVLAVSIVSFDDTLARLREGLVAHPHTLIVDVLSVKEHARDALLRAARAGTGAFKMHVGAVRSGRAPEHLVGSLATFGSAPATRMFRGGASAAATRMFRGRGSRRRRGYDAEIPWRRVAAATARIRPRAGRERAEAWKRSTLAPEPARGREVRLEVVVVAVDHVLL